METAFIIALFQVKRTAEKDLKHLFITSSSSHFFNKTDFKQNHFKARGVASFARSGGQNLNQGGKGFRRNPKAFLAEITHFNVFFAEKHQLLPSKKIPWGGKKKIGWAKTKIGRVLPPLPPRWRRAWPGLTI